MTYRFFYKELQWKFQNLDGIWENKNPPLPNYAEHFTAVNFVLIWKKCRSMNDVHRHLFWLSKSEIENYFDEINVALQECGYEVLPSLKYLTQGIFSDEDLLLLETKGYIKKQFQPEESDNTESDNTESDNTESDNTESSAMTELYNQMQKKKTTYDPLRHVFTTETGKFSVRH